MPIGPLTMAAIYLTIWWTVLFGILPLGASQQDQKPPTDGAQWGAPEKPDLKRKFITTTWVAAIVWGIIMLVIWTGIMPLPSLPPS